MVRNHFYGRATLSPYTAYLASFPALPLLAKIKLEKLRDRKTYHVSNLTLLAGVGVTLMT